MTVLQSQVAFQRYNKNKYQSLEYELESNFDLPLKHISHPAFFKDNSPKIFLLRHKKFVLYKVALMQRTIYTD